LKQKLIFQAAFEVTLEPFLKCQYRDKSFIDEKTRATPGISKQSVIAGYYQRFHFLQDTII
jgi:hypothetical protein